MYRIQLGQPATVKVAANLVRLLSYNNKVCERELVAILVFSLCILASDKSQDLSSVLVLDFL